MLIAPLDADGLIAAPLDQAVAYSFEGRSAPMSDYPCTGCRATNRGRLTYVYLQYFDEQELVRRRVRLCGDCVVDLLPPILEGADYSGDNRSWVPVEVVAVSTFAATGVQHASASSPQQTSMPLSQGGGRGNFTPSAETAGLSPQGRRRGRSKA